MWKILWIRLQNSVCNGILLLALSTEATVMEPQEPDRFQASSSEQGTPSQLSEQQLQDLFIAFFKHPPVEAQPPETIPASLQSAPSGDAFLEKLRRLIRMEIAPDRLSQDLPVAKLSHASLSHPSGSTAAKLPANPIYRFSLPKQASRLERQAFWRKIAIMRQANPEWQIDPDFPRYYEAEAAIAV
jgi:hypothetical protein